MSQSKRPNPASIFASPHTKIAISWITAGTICLTGYYFARLWAVDQKEASLKIKRELTEKHFAEKFKQSSEQLKTSR